MSKGHNIKTLDQFFADKLSEGTVDIDAAAAWDMLEQSTSTAKVRKTWAWKYMYAAIGVLLTIGLLWGIVLSNRTDSDLGLSDSRSGNTDVNTSIKGYQKSANNTKSIATKTTSEIEKQTDVDVSNNLANKLSVNEDYAKEQSEKSNRPEIGVVHTQSGTPSARAHVGSHIPPRVKSTSQQSTYLPSSNSTKRTTQESILSTVSMPSSPNYEKKSGTVGKKSTTESEKLAAPSNEEKATAYITDQRLTLTFESIPNRIRSLDNNPTELSTPLASMPHYSISQPRWSVDLGLGYGKQYELDQVFAISTTSKLQLTHFSLNYDHLTSKYFSTKVYITYDKVHGGEEFVGERIVRTYNDDNLAAGYSVRLNLAKRLGIETAIGLGISFIDKIEYEQKPTWVDGMRVYKDYTRTEFDADPTASYQTQLKVTYQLPYGIDVFVGGTYRSQFANQLSSSQTTRENTLTSYQDLQLMAGVRYYIF